MLQLWVHQPSSRSTEALQWLSNFPAVMQGLVQVGTHLSACCVPIYEHDYVVVCMVFLVHMLTLHACMHHMLWQVRACAM